MASSKSANVVVYVMLVVISLSLIAGIVLTVKKATEAKSSQTIEENYKSVAVRIATQIQESAVFGENTEVQEGLVAYFKLKIPETIDGKTYQIKAENDEIIVESQKTKLYGIKANSFAQSNDAWVYFYKPDIVIIGDSSLRET